MTIGLAFWIIMLVWAVFLFFLASFLYKSYREYKEDRFNVPSFVLISVTTIVSMLIPTFSNLDVAFQGYNTWHSFQYLFLLWLLNRNIAVAGMATTRRTMISLNRAWSAVVSKRRVGTTPANRFSSSTT